VEERLLGTDRYYRGVWCEEIFLFLCGAVPLGCRNVVVFFLPVHSAPTVSGLNLHGPLVAS
jgi:hypothetical protein